MDKLEGFKNITLDEAIREIKKLRQSLVGAVQNAECREEKLEQEIERLREKVKREKQFKSKIFEQSLDKSKEIVRVKKDLGYETDQSLWKGKEIERLKKEKDDLVLANKGRKALTGAQFSCMEKLEKEKEWLLNKCAKNECYIHNLWAPGKSEKEYKTILTDSMQQEEKEDTRESKAIEG